MKKKKEKEKEKEEEKEEEKEKEKEKDKEDISQLMADVVAMWQSAFPKIEDLLREHNDRVSRLGPFKEEVILVRDNGVFKPSCSEDDAFRDLLGRRVYLNNAEGFSEFLKDTFSKDDLKDAFKAMGEVIHGLFCSSYVAPDDDCFYKDEEGTLFGVKFDFSDDCTVIALERFVKFEALLLDYLLNGK